ncbi:MAG TPA: GNAT family N-acetyltransferase [Nocardioidaceae bacterium]|nr:GNAT family N-acetyltransferase [Nocardioidaceae bacterium]
MVISTPRISLEPISPALARRIVDRDESPDDHWHPEYPFADELDPLQGLAASKDPDPAFTLYLLRRRSDGLAVGGFGFFGPPGEDGRIEFGYGLVPSARGDGLATEAVRAALDFAARQGARIAAADTDTANIASQHVLINAGLAEVRRDDSKVFYERRLHE